ncbi:Alpha/Beta hydrolase protein [Hypoxylon sp. FL1150]|nr:Alpha/Beta hydrolase protein [Hypoxylon sp. FL1150]
MVLTSIGNVKADGIDVFYRHAGPKDGPVILLLHGFPASSFMFRNLIPLLAELGYRAIAPDLPGYGFTEVPAEQEYQYSFANYAKTTEAFLDALNIKKFAVYIFDYGAPTGLRVALDRPDDITAIITQNGNAYVEGFGEEFWAPIKKYWESGSVEDRDALRPFLTLDVTKGQYVNGSPHPSLIQPETYYLDQALMDRPGNKEIQLDMLYDYRTNVDLYPKFHEYFRSSGVPILAVWGKNDTIFIPPGAEAFKRDAKRFELHFLDAGHFALETNEVEMADLIDKFLKQTV